MSQMFTINDRKPGDRTISQWMDDTLKPQGVRVWGEAAPNLCNEEATMLLLAFCAEQRTTPAVFIYGLCFDKFRNVDLRPGYQDFLRSRPDIEKEWKATAERIASTYPLASAKMLSTLNDLHASSAAEENTFESRLRARVGSWLPLVEQRKNIYVTVGLYLYQARNKILHITPTTKRPIILSRFDLNKQFLSLMADIAREHHVQLILYVIPLNPLAENPYVPEQYEAFKVYARQFAEERGIPFANLEDVVPQGMWGIFNGGPDFKHFREEGHERTAKAVMAAFEPWLDGTATSTTSIMR
jgi:CRP-like cAMP-binding protein